MRKKILFGCLVLLGFNGLSQVSQSSTGVAINTTGADANPSALLDVSGAGKGVLIPRMTMSERPSNPVVGLMIYQTDNSPGFYYFDGTSWKAVGGSSSSSAVYGHAANTSGTAVGVLLGGSNIALPQSQNISGITVNGTNDQFTVTSAGIYKISYNFSFLSATSAFSRLLVNGQTVPALDFNPSVEVNQHNIEAIVNLNAGDKLTLQLYGTLAAVILQPGAGGASLTIQKL